LARPSKIARISRWPKLSAGSLSGDVKHVTAPGDHPSLVARLFFIVIAKRPTMKSLVLLIAVVLCGVMVAFANEPTSRAVLIGQTTTTTSEAGDLEKSAEKVLVSLGSLGFMAWLCRYMISSALPEKDKEIASARAAFQDEMQKEREAHAANVKELVGQLRKQSEDMMQVIRTCDVRRNKPTQETT
jgi:hypothetical protein